MKIGSTLRTIILAVLTLTAASCNISTPDEAFLASDGIQLTVRGTTVFAYDPSSCQLAFNRKRVEFSVHNDNMSDYYTLTLDRIPEVIDQEVIGNIRWSSGKEMGTKKNITLKVAKLEGDVIWLWSAHDRVEVTVRVLD